ncbi:hypothetical protein KNT91_gp187 [Aeromonas phage 60AhydR15PP]|uniref:Uncharacterized protein n=1 Tax=Aeromonas phage 60AhydR15PP TaxID=2163979 RepID=A0A2S1PGK2_9CAUD|nr:hypothetical protein KNT91_gp187 [Aeromonas phage 60AhydR15PP]AWH15711.1 hypothetical protein [Aeromonas phage 60AhydR15PP]
MELIIDVWKIVSVAIATFIVMRLILVALVSKGFISASDQINEILEKWQSLKSSGQALFGNYNIVVTPLIIALFLILITLFWPIVLLYIIAK